MRYNLYPSSPSFSEEIGLGLYLSLIPSGKIGHGIYNEELKKRSFCYGSKIL
jgi:hypothetical protein